MLAELAVNLLIRAAPGARRLGYARALTSLWSRSRRQAEAWKAHQAHTRSFALAVAEEASRRYTAWVLGGGTFGDIPLAELSGMFNKVIVFDIAHLPGSAERIARHRNVELRLADVTGLVAPLAAWRPGQPLPQPGVAALTSLDPVLPDCILSLNVLSQLPLLPMEWLERHGLPLADRRAYGQAIIAAHLEALARAACPVALVTDARRIWRSRAGETIVAESAVLDVALPAAADEWTWPIAPLGEIDNESSLDFRVIAARTGL